MLDQYDRLARVKTQHVTDLAADRDRVAIPDALHHRLVEMVPPVSLLLKKALADLEANHDLEVREWHQYVVGYVCKQLATNRLVTRDAMRKLARKGGRAA